MNWLSDVATAQAAWEDACNALDAYLREHPLPLQRGVEDTELEVLQADEREAWMALQELRGF